MMRIPERCIVVGRGTDLLPHRIGGTEKSSGPVMTISSRADPGKDLHRKGHSLPVTDSPPNLQGLPPPRLRDTDIPMDHLDERDGPERIAAPEYVTLPNRQGQAFVQHPEPTLPLAVDAQYDSKLVK